MSGSELPSLLWDTDECAAVLRLPAQTLRNWRKRGEGPPAVEINGSTRYRPGDVETWVEGLTATPAPEPERRPAPQMAAPQRERVRVEGRIGRSRR